MSTQLDVFDFTGYAPGSPVGHGWVDPATDYQVVHDAGTGLNWLNEIANLTSYSAGDFLYQPTSVRRPQSIAGILDFVHQGNILAFFLRASSIGAGINGLRIIPNGNGNLQIAATVAGVDGGPAIAGLTPPANGTKVRCQFAVQQVDPTHINVYAEMAAFAAINDALPSSTPLAKIAAMGLSVSGISDIADDGLATAGAGYGYGLYSFWALTDPAVRLEIWSYDGAITNPGGVATATNLPSNTSTLGLPEFYPLRVRGNAATFAGYWSGGTGPFTVDAHAQPIASDADLSGSPATLIGGSPTTLYTGSPTRFSGTLSGLSPNTDYNVVFRLRDSAPTQGTQYNEVQITTRNGTQYLPFTIGDSIFVQNFTAAVGDDSNLKLLANGAGPLGGSEPNPVTRIASDQSESLARWLALETGCDTAIVNANVPGSKLTADWLPTLTESGFTDLVVDGSNPLKVTSAGRPFGSGDVGKLIQVEQAGSFAKGLYRIQSVAGVVATLDRSPGSTGSTGGHFGIGDPNGAGMKYLWNGISSALALWATEGYTGKRDCLMMVGHNDAGFNASPASSASYLAALQAVANLLINYLGLDAFLLCDPVMTAAQSYTPSTGVDPQAYWTALYGETAGYPAQHTTVAAAYPGKVIRLRWGNRLYGNSGASITPLDGVTTDPATGTTIVAAIGPQLPGGLSRGDGLHPGVFGREVMNQRIARSVALARGFASSGGSGYSRGRAVGGA